MPSDITLIFPKETLSLIDEWMHEEGVNNRQAFLTELLIRTLTRSDSTRTWGEHHQPHRSPTAWMRTRRRF